MGNNIPQLIVEEEVAKIQAIGVVWHKQIDRIFDAYEAGINKAFDQAITEATQERKESYMNDQPAENTDRELYREDTGEVPGSYYENSIFVTKQGAIGMNVGGRVFVKPIANWHKLAEGNDLVAPEPLDDDTPANPPYWKENGQIILDESAQATIEDKLWHILDHLCEDTRPIQVFNTPEYFHGYLEDARNKIQAIITTETTKARIDELETLKKIDAFNEAYSPDPRPSRLVSARLNHLLAQQPSQQEEE